MTATPCRLAALMCIALVAPAIAHSAGVLLDDAVAVPRGVPRQDKSDTMQALEALAAAGQVAAATDLARAYYLGEGVPPDIANAIRWWQRAAELGSTDAAYNAGLLLLRRHGDNAAAYPLLRAAAEQDDVLACFALGSALAEDPSADEAEARHWLACAAHAGYAPGQYNLALALARAGATAADLAQSDRWLRAAATTFKPAASKLQNAPLQQPSEALEAEPPRVHDLAWVISQPQEHYTLQVAAGNSGPALARMLKRHASGYDSAWFMHRPRASEPYSAVIGSYGAYAAAQQALASLPAAVRNNAPWIRRFATLQRELEGISQAQANAQFGD